MELRLQQFIDSVETLADIRNLDEFNPIVFQLEHPVTATRFTVVGSKVEPSYLGIPVNTTWIVLDPQSQYYKMALKLVDANDTDRSTVLPPIVNDAGTMTLYWNIIRTYDEIFSVPQYYNNGGKGPKGDKGEKGDAATINYNQAIAALASLTGTLTIVGPVEVNANTTTAYTLDMLESQILADGTVVPPEHRAVETQIFLIGASPDGTYIGTDNVLHVGALTQDWTVKLHATYPSWGKSSSVFKQVVLKSVAATVTGVTMSGPTAANSGTTVQYAISVAWSDGTTTSPTALWALDATSFGTITQAGLLTIPSTINSSGSVNVSATLTIAGTTYVPNMTVAVTKIVAAPTVTGVVLAGPATADSGTTAQYSTIVSWSDGTTTTPAATYTLNSANFGTINSSGLLTVPSTIAASGNVVVTGSVTISGTTYAPTKSVAVTKVVVVATVTNVAISGNSNVSSGSNAQYALQVTWSDGTTTTPAASSWTLDVPDFGTIDSSGLLTVPSTIAASGNVTVNAAVTISGTAYTPTKSVVITKVVVSAVAPFWGTGPALPADWSAFVNGLTSAGSLTVDGKYQVSFDCLGASTYMYFAAPVSHGESTFYDKLSQFFGGWGGAGNAGQGPSSASISNYRDMPETQNIMISGNSVPFYIYRTDFPNLGAAAQNQWEVTLATP